MCDKNTVPSVSAISRLLRGREEEKKPRGKPSTIDAKLLLNPSLILHML